MRKEKLNTRKKLGFILLSVVVFCWIAVPVLPFFDFPYKIIIISVLFAGGEILFILTVALLGKEYWNKIKNGFYRLFSSKKKKESPERQEITSEKDS